MTSLVTIVQHAEKEATPGDPGLTARGRHQAEAVAVALRTTGCDLVVSSPLRRAVETATTIARECGKVLAFDDRLRERMNWDGAQSIDDFLTEWARSTRERSYVPPGGVSSAEAGARFAELVDDAAGTQKGHVVMVSHGGVTLDGLRTLVGDDEVSSAMPHWVDGLPPASVSRLHVRETGVELIAVGENHHLRN
jgi:broad specificity phosphatase PhoE